MSFAVRRIVTGHESDGAAVARSDERLASRNPVEGYHAVEIWESDSLPVRNDESAREGSGPRTRIRIAELAPGHRSPMHRTHTLDYAILLDGECDLHLDDGVVRLQAGDVVVQRGTNHAWHVVGDAPARFAFVLIDAEPLRYGGVELPDTMPAGIDP
jgi:quercetin dioxygenase-like cupin family protein